MFGKTLCTQVTGSGLFGYLHIAALSAPFQPSLRHAVYVAPRFRWHWILSRDGPERPEPVAAGLMQLPEDERQNLLAHPDYLLVSEVGRHLCGRRDVHGLSVPLFNSI